MYKAECASLGLEFYPFVLGSHGGFGRSARAVVWALLVRQAEAARAAPELEPRLAARVDVNVLLCVLVAEAFDCGREGDCNWCTTTHACRLAIPIARGFGRGRPGLCELG